MSTGDVAVASPPCPVHYQRVPTHTAVTLSRRCHGVRGQVDVTPVVRKLFGRLQALEADDALHDDDARAAVEEAAAENALRDVYRSAYNTPVLRQVSAPAELQTADDPYTWALATAESWVCRKRR